VVGGTAPPGFACKQGDQVGSARAWRCTGGPWRSGRKLVFTIKVSGTPVADRWHSIGHLTVQKPVSHPKFSYFGVYGLRIG
jgi:hypothetical protein